MTTLEFGLGNPIDENKTSHAPEKFRRARDQLQHQRRGVSHRARNVGDDHQIDVARPARAKAQIGKCTAALNGGTDSAPKIEASARAPSCSRLPRRHPKASRNRRQRIARLVEFQVGVSLEWGPLDFVQLRLPTALRANAVFEAGFFSLLRRFGFRAILLLPISRPIARG